MNRRLFFAVAVGAILATVSAHAEDDEADRVLRDREEGKIQPLRDIMRIVQRSVPGRIVDTEFEYDDDIPVYEFQVVQQDGRRREVKVDGRDGSIIEIDDED